MWPFPECHLSLPCLTPSAHLRHGKDWNSFNPHALNLDETAHATLWRWNRALKDRRSLCCHQALSPDGDYRFCSRVVMTLPGLEYEKPHHIARDSWSILMEPICFIFWREVRSACTGKDLVNDTAEIIWVCLQHLASHKSPIKIHHAELLNPLNNRRGLWMISLVKNKTATKANRSSKP